MRQRLEAILTRYGRPFTHLPSERTGRGFIQPSIRQSHVHTPVGRADRRRWLYIGSGELPLSVGDTLVCGHDRYCVREAAAVYWLDERPLYWRAELAEAL